MRLCPGDELRSDSAGGVVHPDVRRVVDGVVDVRDDLAAVRREAHGPEGSRFSHRAGLLSARGRATRAARRERREEPVTSTPDLGGGKEKETLPVGQIHPLHNGYRISLRLQARQVEPMGEQRTLLHVQQVSRRSRRRSTGSSRRPCRCFPSSDPTRMALAGSFPGAARDLRPCRGSGGRPEGTADNGGRSRGAPRRASSRGRTCRRPPRRGGERTSARGEDDRPVAVPCPADASLASQIVRTAPPEASIRFNFPSAKNPTDRPSGDQNGKKAFSAPTTGCAEDSVEAADPEGGLPAGLAAVKTRRVPSGESASSPRNIFSGNGSVARMPGRGAGGAPQVAARRTATAASAAIAKADPRQALAALAPRDDRRRHAGRGAGSRRSTGAGASRRGRSGSGLPGPWRDRSSTTRSSAGGVIGWSVAIGAGSSFMIAEIREAWLAPENALLARRHLVEHRAEGEDVGPGVRLLSLELLRRHVLERPEDRPFLRQRSARLRREDVKPGRRGAGATAFARPKSRSFTPDFVSMTLPGFRSRCTIPCRCALSSASAISIP